MCVCVCFLSHPTNCNFQEAFQGGTYSYHIMRDCKSSLQKKQLQSWKKKWTEKPFPCSVNLPMLYNFGSMYC